MESMGLRGPVVFDIDAVRGDDSNTLGIDAVRGNDTLEGLGGWNQSPLEADRGCGIQWNFHGELN